MLPTLSPDARTQDEFKKKKVRSSVFVRFYVHAYVLSEYDKSTTI
jgi:hypothetical protein